MPAIRRAAKRAPILAAAAALVLATAAPAPAAADDLRFWDGTLASDDCGPRTFLGSLSLDNPFESGISWFGTIIKYKRTCSYPTSANQTCWYTLVQRGDNGTVTATMNWRNPAGQTWSSSDTGTGDVSSPVVCDHQVDGSSWWGTVKIGGVAVTLYT